MGAALLPAPTAGSGEAPRPPNVLVLQPDQHRGDVLGSAGDRQAKTPHLDRLAREGIRFANAFTNTPLCSPARATLQTGLYWYQHGVIVNDVRLPVERTTFAEVFAAAGYATGYIGKWHLDGGWPESSGHGTPPMWGFIPPERRQGWQEWTGYEKGHSYFEVQRYDDDGRRVRVEGADWEPRWQTDMALDFIRRHQRAGRPWLYYISYGPPHYPEECPSEFLALYPLDEVTVPADVARGLPEEARFALRRALRVYYAQVSAVDAEVGRLLEALEQLGADRDTIVLYTSDHGDLLGRHYAELGRVRGKALPVADALRIPLLVRWPAAIPAGRVVEAPVPLVDVAPTLLDLAGLPVPDAMAGVSQADWARGGAGPEHRIVYLGAGDGSRVPSSALGPAQRRKKGRRPPLWRGILDGRFLYAPAGLLTQGGPRLYDLHVDPSERVNLIDSPGHASTRRRLLERMLGEARATGDPAAPRLRALLDAMPAPAREGP